MNKTAIVTGASKGIGKEIALKLASQGIKLFLTARSEKELSDLSGEINKKYSESSFLAADLEKKNTPARIITQAIDYLGQLDILINNAGYAYSCPFEETKASEWDKAFTINAKAPYFITLEALPFLKNSAEASIINISSVVGRLGYPLQSVYGASKHALVGWTKSLAKEVQKDNIRVHLIAPGGVDTSMISNTRPDIDKSKLIQPSEIAEITWFLISNRNNAMVDEINIRRSNATPWQ